MIMKKLFLLTVLVFTANVILAQTVENIRVEQDGDNLKIFYRIGGSSADQLYSVTLTCSLDGGAVFEPMSVIGDVGDNIAGGKSFNTVVWDVFEDLEEVGSFEFFVKVELMEKESQGTSIIGESNTADKKVFERTISLGYNGAFSASVHHLYGVKLSTLGNWGGYASFRTGGYDSAWGGYLLSITAGATKHITTQDKLRLHGFLGVGAGDYADTFEGEGGVIGIISDRISIELGAAITIYFVEVTFGVGYVF